VTYLKISSVIEKVNISGLAPHAKLEKQIIPFSSDSPHP
jgi:hypothetical protein